MMEKRTMVLADIRTAVLVPFLGSFDRLRSGTVHPLVKSNNNRM